MSLDEFLGGKLRLEQADKGFRSGSDTIMLAASIPAQRGETVLELGAGSGIALCVLGFRVHPIHAYGVEILKSNVDRANRNLQNSHIQGEVHLADMLDMPQSLLQKRFHHVFMNPPFYAQNAFTPPKISQKESAHIALQPLSKWVQIGGKRVAPKGSLTIIAPTPQLSEILEGLKGFGAIRILPISSKHDEPAKRIIVQARAQSKADLKILPAFLTHQNSGQISHRAHALAYEGDGLYELWQ